MYLIELSRFFCSKKIIFVSSRKRSGASSFFGIFTVPKDPLVNRHVMFYEVAMGKPRRGKARRPSAYARWTGKGIEDMVLWVAVQQGADQSVGGGK